MKIIQLSDLHIGEHPKVNEYLEKAIDSVNNEKPDLILITGDITHEGIREQYQEAKQILKKIKYPWLAVPGNHDSKNVGYKKFEKFINKRNFSKKIKDIDLIGIDSSEPDLDEGHVGRDKYEWISKKVKSKNFSVIMMHHHTIPVPGAGRERHMIIDAGDFLKEVTDQNVNLVLSGHKHVCNLWKIKNTIFLNASTASSVRTRGVSRGYNIIKIKNKKVTSINYKSLDTWSSNKKLL